MKLLSVHAHFDDYEFFASGTFELCRRKNSPDFQARVVVCTDGQAGHQFRTRAETGKMRYNEQMASADIGKYELEMLRLPDGTVPREGCVTHTPVTMAAFWKAIRDFEPDYLFCPPLVADPLAGIHIDHVAVADAIRKVAYLINVPHAYTPEYPADETQSKPCQTPVILNVYDNYVCGSNTFDFAVEVEDAFDVMAAMSYCHQSQIMEWLPWVGCHQMSPPKNSDEWKQMLRQRLMHRNRELGIASDRAIEVFVVTAWGSIPSIEQIDRDFPNILWNYSCREKLKAKLIRWGARN